MAWWIKPQQLADDAGNGTGRWRLTATSDEDGGGPWPCCDCEGAHGSPEAAAACPKATKKAESYG
jgi:hypothetical protein